MPLEIKVVGEDGVTRVQHDIMESQREVTVKLPKDAKDTLYKLNADTCGVCKWLMFYCHLIITSVWVDTAVVLFHQTESVTPLSV